MIVTLAHGTSARHLPDILAHGLRPRGADPSLWTECPSHPARVYLSNCYAFYFGQQAAGEDGEDVAIIEVAVKRAKLFPDEDFIGQLKGTPWADLYPDDIKRRTMAIRDDLGGLARKTRLALADESIERLGNAAHDGPIRARRITRVAVIPKADIARIVMAEHDPTVSLINHRFCGAGHKAFQESLFTRYPMKVPA